MEFGINQKTLLNALKTVAPAVDKKAYMEALKYVHIECISGVVKFTTTNMDLTLSATEKVDWREAGSVCLNHKELVDLVSKLPKGADVSFRDLVGDYAETILTCGPIRRPLLSLPSEEFPHAPFVGNPFHSFDLGGQGTLYRALERVLPCVAKADESRAVLTGALFQSGPKGSKVSATDGRRAMRLEFASGGCREAFQAIVPGKALQVLSKLLKDPKRVDEACDLRFTEGQAWCSIVTGNSSVKWQVRCLEGTFPDLDRVFPQTFTRSWSFNSRDLVAPLERAMQGNASNPYKSKGDNEDIVVFSMLGLPGYGTMKISGQNENISELLPAPGWDGEPLRFSLNGEYLLELFKSPVGEQLVLNIQDETRSMTLHGRDSASDWCQVIMPMKLRQHQQPEEV